MPLFEHHLFICTNERDSSASRPSCLPEGSKKLKSAFKDAIKTALGQALDQAMMKLSLPKSKPMNESKRKRK